MALVNALVIICEKVLRETDEVHTLVRVVDLFTIPDDPKAAVQLALWVQIKLTADDEHKHSLSLVLVRPTGEREETVVTKETVLAPSLTPNLPHRILMAQGNMTVGMLVPGLYTYDVLFDGEVVAKTHFVVVVATPEEKPDSQPSDSSPHPKTLQ
jgi:hypothetical protein